MARRKRYHLPVLIEQDEDGIFIVSVPTLRGCRSYGKSIEEAMTNIREATKLTLEDMAEHGETPPAGDTLLATIQV